MRAASRHAACVEAGNPYLAGVEHPSALARYRIHERGHCEARGGCSLLGGGAAEGWGHPALRQWRHRPRGRRPVAVGRPLRRLAHDVCRKGARGKRSGRKHAGLHARYGGGISVRLRCECEPRPADSTEVTSQIRASHSRAHAAALACRPPLCVSVCMWCCVLRHPLPCPPGPHTHTHKQNGRGRSAAKKILWWHVACHYTRVRRPCVRARGGQQQNLSENSRTEAGGGNGGRGARGVTQPPGIAAILVYAAISHTVEYAPFPDAQSALACEQ